MLNEGTKKRIFAIAIDGPSGSGKGTIAKCVAKQLGVLYIDTGAMYRAVALYFIKKGIDLDCIEKIADMINEVEISIRHVDDKQRIFLFGEDVTKEIYNQQIADGASKVAVVFEVRQKLVALQRQIAKENCVVMDGRDIGSYVLPDADLKVYLDASLEQRAQRRLKQLAAKGSTVAFETVKKELEERDYRDQTREASPLKKAEDAMYLDSSDLDIEQVCEQILNQIKNDQIVK